LIGSFISDRAKAATGITGGEPTIRDDFFNGVFSVSDKWTGYYTPLQNDTNPSNTIGKLGIYRVRFDYGDSYETAPVSLSVLFLISY
jgi:MoaA/NifB/PqqE/SkfB family radical SAM enzyme